MSVQLSQMAYHRWEWGANDVKRISERRNNAPVQCGLGGRKGNANMTKRKRVIVKKCKSILVSIKVQTVTVTVLATSCKSKSLCILCPDARRSRGAGNMGMIHENRRRLIQNMSMFLFVRPGRTLLWRICLKEIQIDHVLTCNWWQGKPSNY